MKLNELKPFKGEIKKKKRRGRGPASGLGCTAGKGNKGQKARAGKGPAPAFEGGQMPLVRRLPKRGFRNPFKERYNVFNLDFIAKKFQDKEEVTLEDLYKYCKKNFPIKILGNGDLNKGLKIWAHKFSKSAVEKITQAGGEAKALEGK